MEGYDLTISGLMRKRAEIAKDVERQSAALAASKVNLASIEAALSVFGHDERPATPRLLNIMFRRGELSRMIPDALRAGPMTGRQLTVMAMEAKGIEQTRDAYERANKAALKAIRKLRDRGVVEASKGEHGALVYGVRR